jgi:predicted permease
MRDDVDAELEFHIQGRVDELIARGMPRGDAEREARERFGDFRRIETEVTRLDRDRLRRRTLQDRWQSFVGDLRFAVRSLVRQPLYSLVVIGTLTLGIGTTAAIFHAVDRVVLHPLPYPDAGRIVFLGMKRDKVIDIAALTPGRFQFWHDESRAFDALATWRSADAVFNDDDTGPVAHAMRVTSDFFRVVGVHPALGRVLVDADYRVEAAPAALVTDAFWRSRLGGDHSVLGQTVRLDSTQFTVVGILPPSFDVVGVPTQPDFLVPLVLTPRQLDGGGANYTVIGRLRENLSVEQIDADMTATFAAYRTARPEQIQDAADAGVAVLRFQEAFTGGLAPTLWILFGATGFVFLLACANVANIVLARTVNRQRELAVRTALGAGRGRIVWQIVLETIVLGVVSAVLATLGSLATVRGVVGLAHQSLLRDNQLRLDWRVVVYVTLIAVAASLLVGLIVALAATRADLTKSLAGSTRSGGIGPRRPTLRGALVTIESALAMVLLAGAGLLMTSFARVLAVDGGFRRDGIYTATIPRAPRDLSGVAPIWRFDQRVLENLRATPGILAAASTATLPLVRGWNIPTTVEGRDDATLGGTEWRAVSPGYFRAMDIPVLVGRDVSESDDEQAAAVVIVSKSYANQFFPDENPIGQRILVGSYKGRRTKATDAPREIIGVVPDLRDGSLEQTQLRSTVWLPQAQATRGLVGVPAFVVRANDPRVAATALRRAISAADPRIPSADVAAMSDIVSRSLSSRRFTLLLMTTFATVALALTCIGIYGVASYSVSQRRQEIGVRIALGAQAGSVVGLVVRQALRPTAIGLGIGVVAALLLSRVIARMLFGIGPRDPLSFGVVALVLIGVSAIASYVPARRASRVDPMEALRSD